MTQTPTIFAVYSTFQGLHDGLALLVYRIGNGRIDRGNRAIVVPEALAEILDKYD